jgi:predicted NBD/HSP70 family sugar kinase
LGLSRGTVSQRLDALFAANLVRESDETLPSGGRPSRTLRFNAGFGIALVADIGETHVRVAVTDLEPKILAQDVAPIDLAAGPEDVLDSITAQFRILLARAHKADRDVMGIGLSLPAPVDYERGRVVGWSVLTGWDGFDIRGHLGRSFQVPVVPDNDVNVLTLAEHRAFWPRVRNLLFVKVGTGIGSGIMTDGSIYRGARGAAGDIGHVRLGGHGDPLCRCGSTGCVEALGAGWAIARDLRDKGFNAHNARDVLALVARSNQPVAVQLLRRAGRIVGEVVADAVSILNPSVVVLGGVLARPEPHLIVGTRELVYQRSLPLATQDLVIASSHLDDEAGVIGAGRLVVETLFHQPGPIMQRLAGATATTV